MARGTVSELRGAEQEEDGSHPPPLAVSLGAAAARDAGPAARRPDVTEAAAVVGAGSAAAKCELRSARTAGGVKSGSGRGEGRGGAGRRRRFELVLLRSAAHPASRRWLQPSFLASLCSVLVPLQLCSSRR